MDSLFDSLFLCVPIVSHTRSRALLGVKADEVHLCGGPEALPVVESLLASTQDTFEVIRYERATALQ